jgi:hypothetical protein
VRKKKPRRHVSPGLGLLGVDKGKGELRGATSKLVSIDNARVARKFPRTSERVRDGRRCHTSAGGKCDTGTRAASVGRLSRPAGALARILKTSQGASLSLLRSLPHAGEEKAPTHVSPGPRRAGADRGGRGDGGRSS